MREARALLAEQQQTGAGKLGVDDRYRARQVVDPDDRYGALRGPGLESVHVLVVHDRLVPIGHHRTPSVPPAAADDVHRGSEECVRVTHHGTDVEVVLPVLDSDMERVPSGVEVGDNRFASPVTEAVDNVSPVTVAQQVRVEAGVIRPWVRVRPYAYFVRHVHIIAVCGSQLRWLSPYAGRCGETMSEGAAGVGGLPDVLVVGTMKSGTTALARHLNSHPEVYFVPGKEIYFFERDALWEQGLDYYRALFAGARDEKRVAEGSPGTMFYPQAVERLAATIPEARLVAILRHPTERAWSQYRHEKFFGRVQDPFEKVVERELALPQEPHIVARSQYLTQLRRLTEHFPREHIHVILLEDLHEHPIATWHALCNFLDIDPSWQPPGLEAPVNPRTDHRARWLFVALHRYRLWRWMPSAWQAVSTCRSWVPPKRKQCRAPHVHGSSSSSAPTTRPSRSG